MADMKWIPITEGPPKKDGWYLVTTYSSRGERMVMISIYHSIPKIFEDFMSIPLNVLAWIPYPEPYDPNN